MKKASQGFTLLEVLVGLTLLGLVLVMLFSGLYTTSRSWTAGDTQAEINDDYRLTLSFIQHRINETVPILFIDNKDNNVIFQGEEKSLFLVTPLPAHRGGGGLYVVSFSLIDNDETSALEFAYQPLIPEGEWFDDDNEKITRQKLIDSVSEITFSYFGNEEENDDPRWHDSWKEQKRLPELVRLQINSEETVWPELTIRIPAQVQPGQAQLTLTKSRTRTGT